MASQLYHTFKSMLFLECIRNKCCTVFEDGTNALSCRSMEKMRTSFQLWCCLHMYPTHHCHGGLQCHGQIPLLQKCALLAHSLQKMSMNLAENVHQVVLSLCDHWYWSQGDTSPLGYIMHGFVCKCGKYYESVA